LEHFAECMEIKAAQRAFEATLFRTSGEPAREPGRITFTSHGVEFQNHRSTLRLPLDGLAVTAGGANKRLIYLTHPSEPALTIAAVDRSILAVLAEYHDVSIAPQLRRARMVRRGVVLGALGAVVLVAAVCLGLWTLKDPFAGLIARSIPIAWEEKLGSALAPMIVNDALDDPALNERLDRFLQPLTDEVRKKGYHPRFYLRTDDDLNAYALPGGLVVIHSAVIERAESGTEVLGVAAHELAHVTERHITRNIVSSVGIYAFVSFLFGDAVGGIAALANTAPLLLSKSYSRDLERHADDVGLVYLTAADIDPRGMAAFFERVLREEERQRGALAPIPGAAAGMAFLSTHPSTTERIERLRAAFQSLPPKSYRSVENEFRLLQTALRAAAAGSRGANP